MKCYAIMRGHTTYSLRPWKDPWGRKTPFRYQGFCDGQACGLFRTKADFEAFVNADTPPPVADHPQAKAAHAVEARAALEGHQLLQKLRLMQKIRRQT